jgi:transcriptional regulator with XRE-family HTH domain
MQMSFGSLIAEARRHKKLTLRKLSQLVGLSPSFLSELEQGRRQPPKKAEKIVNLSVTLGIDHDKLLGAAEKERSKKKSPLFMDKLFQTNEDLAWGLCRAANDADKDELEEAFKQALEILKKKGTER